MESDIKEVLAQRHVLFAWLVISVADNGGQQRKWFEAYTASAGHTTATQSKAFGNIFTLVLDAEAQLMSMCSQL